MKDKTSGDFVLSDRILTPEERKNFTLFYDIIPADDVKEFVWRLKEKKQKRIDYLLQENSGESISEAEQLAEELNEIDKLAGEKLI